MSETHPNQGLFRIYAVAWLVAAAFVIVIAFQVSDLPDVAVAIYLGIGVALWVVNMALTGGAPRQGHGLSHALLAAAFALVWPLVIAAACAALGSMAFKALWRSP